MPLPMHHSMEVEDSAKVVPTPGPPVLRLVKRWGRGKGASHVSSGRWCLRKRDVGSGLQAGLSNWLELVGGQDLWGVVV